jgi:ankyrin repeat protein
MQTRSRINETNDAKGEQLFNLCDDADATMNATLLEKVKGLVAEGANLKWKSVDGNTCLMMACYNGHIEVVKLLLAAQGISANEKQYTGGTALIFACLSKHIEIVKLLLAVKRININAQDGEQWTALMLACKREQIEIVKLLLAAKGININLKNYNEEMAIDIVNHLDDGKVKDEMVILLQGEVFSLTQSKFI